MLSNLRISIGKVNLSNCVQILLCVSVRESHWDLSGCRGATIISQNLYQDYFLNDYDMMLLPML